MERYAILDRVLLDDVELLPGEEHPLPENVVAPLLRAGVIRAVEAPEPTPDPAPDGKGKGRVRS